MKILILGSAGMIGQKLVAKLLSLKTINEKKIQELILFDVITTPKINETDIKIQIKTGDFSDPTVSKNLVKDKPELIFHLAATFERTSETLEFWEENYDHNIKLSNHIGTICKNLPNLKRVVFTSSYLIYNERI